MIVIQFVYPVSFHDLYLSLHYQGKVSPWDTGVSVSRDVLTVNSYYHSDHHRECEHHREWHMLRPKVIPKTKASIHSKQNSHPLVSPFESETMAISRFTP